MTRTICGKLRGPAAREMAGLDPTGTDGPTHHDKVGASVRFGSGGDVHGGGGDVGDDDAHGGAKLEGKGVERPHGGGGDAHLRKTGGRAGAGEKSSPPKVVKKERSATHTFASRAAVDAEARERDRAKIRDLTAEIKDLRGKISDLEKATSTSTGALRSKEKSMNSLIERGNQKSVELQSALSKIANMERLNNDLGERVNGLTMLVTQTEAKLKSASAKARHYRERLSAAEASGMVPPAEMTTLPVVSNSSRAATPTPGDGSDPGSEPTSRGGDEPLPATRAGRFSFSGRATPTSNVHGGGGDPPAGRGYREAMQEKIRETQEALKASEAQVAKHKRAAAAAKAAANKAVEDAVRLTALCLEKGVDLDSGAEPGAEFLAQAMEAFKVDSQLEAIGLAKHQLVARAARAEESKRAAAVGQKESARREKGWNDTVQTKNPLAKSGDNWRKQQLKAQGVKPGGVAAKKGVAKKAAASEE